MRIAVIGAGAVGGAIAALLVRAGHEVEVTARGAHLTAMRENGIRLTGAWGEYTAAVLASEQLNRGAELVIVATKALLEKNPNPTETEARYWLAGNLCRCTGYDKIIKAVMSAAAEMRGA